MPPWRATHNQSYSSLGDAIGVHRCRGILPHSGQRCYERHEGGADGGSITMDPPYPYVHWSDRRMTRAGIKAFLMLASKTKVIMVDQPDWVVLFRRVQLVGEWLRFLGFRLAKTEWKLERAKLRAMIPARSQTPEELVELRTQAMAWSRP